MQDEKGTSPGQLAGMIFILVALGALYPVMKDLLYLGGLAEYDAYYLPPAALLIISGIGMIMKKKWGLWGC